MKSLIQTSEQVRAFLAGRRTRFCVPIVIPWKRCKGRDIEIDEYGLPVVFDPSIETHAWIPCPYAKIKHDWSSGKGIPNWKTGERLFVKETWAKWAEGDYPDCCVYRADDDPRDENFANPWRSPIHTPEWAARIFLAIKDVKVMQVQETRHKDALAEGVKYNVSKPNGAPLTCFRMAWDAQHGKRHPWSANPWVFAFSVEMEIKQ
jgi:hypothetical protein